MNGTNTGTCDVEELFETVLLTPFFDSRTCFSLAPTKFIAMIGFFLSNTKKVLKSTYLLIHLIHSSKYGIILGRLILSGENLVNHKYNMPRCITCWLRAMPLLDMLGSYFVKRGFHGSASIKSEIV